MFENVVWKMATILSRPQCVKAEHEKYTQGLLWLPHNKT